MVLDPQNPMSCSVKLEGGTITFMAPELLAPSKFELKSAVPTREADIYAFGLVILQVIAHFRRLLVFLDISLGPNGRVPVPEHQATGTLAPRHSRCPARSTRKCGEYRDLRLLVGTHEEVLESRQNAKASYRGSRERNRRRRSELADRHATEWPGTTGGFFR